MKTLLRYKHVIIGVLVVICVIIVVLGLFIPNEKKSSNNAQTDTENPSPTNISPFPSATRVPVAINRTKADTILSDKLTKPIQYQGLTIEFFPRSQTLIVYFSGTQEDAELGVVHYLNSVGVSSTDTHVEYRSTKFDVSTEAPNGFFEEK